MRRQHPLVVPETPAPTFHNSTSPFLFNTADAWNVMSSYYLEKIQEHNERLQQLNLLEDAREIATICHEIIRAKKALWKLSIRTGYLA